ncbi:MAG: hypothetical protein J5817_02500 [Treponema sp.]|nr:hypothetical protein [Treponema sp.]
MKRNLMLKTLCPILCILLASCATTNSISNKKSLHGMVSDLRGEPVANYSILDQNKKVVATTDERGFFCIEVNRSCKKEFTGSKEKWESARFNFANIPANRLYLLQIKSAKDLKDEFENFLSQGNYYQAEKTLLKCREASIKEEKLNLYESILAYKQGDFARAKNLLLAAKEKSSAKEESPETCKYEEALNSKIQNTNQEKGESK